VFCAQINLSRNQLCGYDVWGAGTYTPEGIKAIADAIGVSGSLTQVLAFLSAVVCSACLHSLLLRCVCVQIKLSNNALCGVINATYLGSHKSLTPLGTYNAEGIKVIADAIGISRSLTQVCAHWTLCLLITAVITFMSVIHPSVSSACSCLQVDLSGNHLFYEGGKAIANGIRVSPSLTQVLA
jgi:hypothetical protein